MGWSSLPPGHKKAFVYGVAAYALAAALTAGFVWSRAETTLANWQARIPRAEVPINQSGQGAPDFSNDNTIAAPNAAAGGDAKIALVMTDLGLSDSATKQAVNDLPETMALAFSPYSTDLAAKMNKAKNAGHETLILIPMEPLSYPKDDPGPEALLTRQSDSVNAHKLDDVLTSGAGAMGAMNFMGSALLQDQKNVTAVVTALQKRQLLFVENPQGPESIAEDVASGLNAPFLEGDAVIDATASDLAIRQQLAALETQARKNGYATGVAHPFPVTFSILKDWADSLARRGFKLVPLSALVKEKVQHDQDTQKAGAGAEPKAGQQGPQQGTGTQPGTQPATQPSGSEPPAAPEEQPPPLPQ